MFKDNVSRALFIQLIFHRTNNVFFSPAIDEWASEWETMAETCLYDSSRDTFTIYLDRNFSIYYFNHMNSKQRSTSRWPLPSAKWDLWARKLNEATKKKMCAIWTCDHMKNNANVFLMDWSLLICLQTNENKMYWAMQMTTHFFLRKIIVTNALPNVFYMANVCNDFSFLFANERLLFPWTEHSQCAFWWVCFCVCNHWLQFITRRIYWHCDSSFLLTRPTEKLNRTKEKNHLAHFQFKANIFGH